MRAVDTNVIVRLIVRDDQRQVTAAEAFVGHGIWISVVALVEAITVLASVYEHPPSQLAAAIDGLLNNPQVTLQDRDMIASALNTFRDHPSVGFTDCVLLELARKAGHLPLGTFDRNLAKIDGAQRL
jgi:predicted nucleic-acid-binding protein